MKFIFEVAIVALMLSVFSWSQQGKTLVSVLRTGNDSVGSLFAISLNQAISKSSRYKIVFEDQQKSDSEKIDAKILGTATKGLEFYIELSTIAVDDRTGHQSSAVSVVVENMGLPNSWPVPYMWYHKIIVVRREQVDTMATQLLADMDARWCRTIKNSNIGCPQELWDPQIR